MLIKTAAAVSLSVLSMSCYAGINSFTSNGRADGLPTVVPKQSIKLEWSVTPGVSVTLDGAPVTGSLVSVIVPEQGSALAVTYTLRTSDGGVKTLNFRYGSALTGEFIKERYTAGCDPREPVPTHYYPRVEPRHCATVRVEHPVFVWPQADSLKEYSMSFTLVDPDGNKIVDRQSVSIPRLLLDQPLTKTGVYTWTVVFARAGYGDRTQTRKFEYLGAELDSYPSAATVTATVRQKQHPRIVPRENNGTPVSFTTIRSKLGGGHLETLYDRLLTTALAEKDISTLPPEPNTGMSGTGRTNATITATRPLERIAIAAVITKDSTYRDAALKRMLAMAAWDVSGDGPTGETTEGDQANREIYLTLARALDLLYADMTAAEKKQSVPIAQAIVARMKLAIDHYDKKFELLPNLQENPYDSHGLTGALYLAEALMYTSGMDLDGFKVDPDGTMLSQAWDRAVTTLAPWGSGDDSAFGNSTYYGWMTLDVYSRTLAAFKLLADIDLGNTPALHKFHDNFIAFTPRTREKDTLLGSPFGDSAERTDNYYSYAWNSYRLYAHVTGKPIDEWYYRDNSPKLEIGDNTQLRFFNFFMFGLSVPPGTAETPELPNSYLFEDAGLVAMHSDTANPDRSSLYFRSSRLGTYNHNHGDNNGFAFVSKGSPIFISSGEYGTGDENVPSEKKALLRRATRYKNALTYDDGMGQAEPKDTTRFGIPEASMRTVGRLTNYYTSDTGWTVTTGDATSAYQQRIADYPFWESRLKSAIRTVAYNRKLGIAVIYDYAESDKPRYWAVNFHTPREISRMKGELGSGKFQVFRSKKAGAVPADDEPPSSFVCVTQHGLAGALGPVPFPTQRRTSITMNTRLRQRGQNTGA
ncbi:heparinase II/III domain-containing protein [Pseudoduganella plicata]|uniref:Heparinase II/III-like C-terminal domain-containing protein n=1 Tax=Pseudoduganella plicata TaxID=321984 RepID=A0ABX5SGB8_9BURK|nr:heparinase II/III family protein [Pseudoduganella plicata]QBQ38592.1 hypothetical protein E1742_22255 [Pseudoduganella plicata]